jgi:enterochelin esterase-like enzyme
LAYLASYHYPGIARCHEHGVDTPIQRKLQQGAAHQTAQGPAGQRSKAILDRVWQKRLFFEGVKNLRVLYDEIGFKYTYRESNGGHSWNNWRLYLSELAPMLFQ